MINLLKDNSEISSLEEGAYESMAHRVDRVKKERDIVLLKIEE